MTSVVPAQKRIHPADDSATSAPDPKRPRSEATSHAVSATPDDTTIHLTEANDTGTTTTPSTDNSPPSASSTNNVNQIDDLLCLALEIQPKDSSIVLCERLWFPDGNLTIRADSLTEMKLFNVHVAVLSHFSKVFKRDVTPEFTSRAPTVQTNVIVSPDFLQRGPRFTAKLEDSPDEVGFFLYAMYEKLFLTRRDTLRMEAILAIIKLGYKYDAKTIAKEAIARIVQSRAEIAAFQQNDDRTDGAVGANEDEGPIQEQSSAALTIVWDPVYAIPLANLAYALNLKTVLPLALYACYRQGHQYIVDGAAFPDGTNGRLHDDLVAKLSVDGITFGDPLDGCRPSRHATTCWKDFAYPPGPEHVVDELHPIGTLQDWRSVCKKRDMCSWCAASVESKYKKQIQHYFSKKIPQAFGLL